MKLVSIDDLKTAYREALVNNLIDERRGIDWSEYAEEPSNYFNKFIDDLPLTDVLDQIRAEIKAASHGKWYVGRLDGKTEEVLLMDEVMEIIDKYTKEDKKRDQ